jgi:hypothetical protein
MKLTPDKRREETSATITQTLGLILAVSGLFVLTAYAADPAWWSTPGPGSTPSAVMAEQVVTNDGVVTTNYVPNPYAAVNQGQLKQFTVRAVSYLNATLSGGAGTNLNTLVSNWAQDYATNGYATNTANPTRPYKPSDLQAENVGQLKYIASLVYTQLAGAGYTGLYPSWIVQNTTTDNNAANLGQLKEVFDFDLSVAPAAVTNLVATTGNPDEIDLFWTLPAMNNAQTLSIEVSTNGGATWTTLATLSPTTTSYAATGLDPTQDYEVQVVSSHTNPSTGQQQSSTASLPTATQPIPPPQYAVIDLGTNRSPSALSNTGYVLMWDSATFRSVFRWYNGVTQEMSTPSGVVLIAFFGSESIDDQGDVPLGALSETGPTPQAYVWPGSSTSTTPIPLPDQSFVYPYINWSYASTIDLNGTIYGAQDEINLPPPYDPTDSAQFQLCWTTLGTQPAIYDSANPDGYTMQAKNNHTVGETPSETYLVDGNPVDFEPADISTAGVVVAYSNLVYTDATHQDTIPGATELFALNHATRNRHNSDGSVTPVECPQILGTDSNSNSVLYQKNPDTGIYGSLQLSQLIPQNSGWSDLYGVKINDSGAIVGGATYTPQSSSDPIPAGGHGVMLIPIQLRVDDRDDPTQTWSSNVLQPGLVPVYAGQVDGDMVSWKLGGTDSWTSATFTWTVTDSNGNPVVDQNGVTITGPSGAGINEWRIATWSAGGNDPANQWLTWNPGTYNIKCTINGTTSATFQQVVGQRTKDVVVIAWINGPTVPLSATGVDLDVQTFFPISGSISTTAQKLLTAAYLGDLSSGDNTTPTGGTLTSADSTYILNWMFKYGGNSAPPNSFANEDALEAFEDFPTNFKLFNRLQIHYLINGPQFTSSSQFGSEQYNPRVTNDPRTEATDIGTTIDPVLGQQWPGQQGPENGWQKITGNKSFHQVNDGSPDGWAVAAFNTLMSPLLWNDIGSKIDEGIPLDQGTPPVTGYTVETQVYPTYYIYERASDNGFYLMKVIPQAATPSGNFNSSPYYVTTPTGSAPYTLPYP